MNTATYCPEDDKIRLYTGRVDRDLYLELRNEGWTSTPKQDCDFVAVWTKLREDRALELCGYIGDEDQSPADRAADRAERFGGYRDKRLDEALGHADAFEAQPMAHGYQSEAKANREAAKHERIGVKAYTQWEKAEYWTSRTAGVISHALYHLKPSVRMGRIKGLEADERKILKGIEDHNLTVTRWEKLNTIEDLDKRARVLEYLCGECWSKYEHEGENLRLYQLHDRKLSPEQLQAFYLSNHKRIEKSSHRGLSHVRLRLQYERTMLEAAGGMAGEIEMQVGGWIGNYQIHKVNKSNTSGRVVSVDVLTEALSGYHYKTRNIKGTDKAYLSLEVEKMAKDGYRAPTPEDIEAVKTFKASLKAKAPKALPLINPTKEAAEALQAIWNQQQEERASKSYGYKPGERSSEVIEMTQTQYSARSRGDYSPCGTVYIGTDGKETHRQYCGNTSDGAACKVRKMSSTGSLYAADRVVIITDKPQKALPAFTVQEAAA